jgi:heme oxygenase
VSLPLRLRSSTSEAHKRLEQDLNLLGPPLDQVRITGLLKRFWGFHAVWEPAIGRHRTLESLMVGRYRLDLLTADLAALGMSQRDIKALPLCVFAGGLAMSLEGAWGSLYVMEGSVLGGRIISKALEQAAWMPPGGLRYFDPRGPKTRILWRRFQEVLSTLASPAEDPLVELGALQTFRLLNSWLVDGTG